LFKRNKQPGEKTNEKEEWGRRRISPSQKKNEGKIDKVRSRRSKMAKEHSKACCFSANNSPSSKNDPKKGESATLRTSSEWKYPLGGVWSDIYENRREEGDELLLVCVWPSARKRGKRGRFERRRGGSRPAAAGTRAGRKWDEI